VDKEITANDYRSVLDTGESISKDVYGIRSFDHEVYTTKMRKVALTPHYDKFYMVNSNECLPFGHYSIPRMLQ
jgi:hypothetical protein